MTRLLSFLLLVPEDRFDQIGGFDERFELESYEDDDFCYRALLAGFGLYVAQDCFVKYVHPPDLFPDRPNWLALQMADNRESAQQKWNKDILDALNEWRSAVSISLCMIVKNEQQTLARCLSSVAELVDEIIIVDTGSTDDTKQIAAQFTSHVLDFEWVDDFAKARNFAFSHATKEFILWLDADDILLPPDQEKFRSLTAALPWSTDAVSMFYNLAVDAAGNATTSLRRNRLVRRSNGNRWIGIVHEYLAVTGHILASDIAVTHERMHTNSSRNLQLYEKRAAAGETFSPRDQFYFANERFDHGLWEQALELYEAFIADNQGWVEDNIAACGKIADCYANLGRLADARRWAVHAFTYALPRAEACCRMGAYDIEDKDYESAIWWYKLAAGLTKPVNTNALLQTSYWTWLPHMQLCVCYDRIGQHQLANIHNEIAASFLPDDERVLANRAYFATLL